MQFPQGVRHEFATVTSVTFYIGISKQDGPQPPALKFAFC
jgi:hypothetical protein